MGSKRESFALPGRERARLSPLSRRDIMRRHHLLFGSFIVLGCSSGSQSAVSHVDASPEGDRDARADRSAPSEGGKLVRGDGSSPRDDARTDGSDPVDAATCDPTKPPSEAPCVVSEAYGVFVAPGGAASGAGTRVSPYGDISYAISRAGGKRVYVCAATYTAPLTLSSVVGGLSIYGGFACPPSEGGTAEAGAPAWSYTGAPATVAPVARGYALSVVGVTSAVTFEDFAFVALPGLDAGAASIAVFIAGSSDVSFSRVSATAGAGADGANGASADGPGVASNWCDAGGQAGGTGAHVLYGGSPGVCQCAQQTGVYSYGGVGGSGGSREGSDSGTDGGSVPPVIVGAGSKAGHGGPGAQGETACLDGYGGANGAAASVAVAGAPGFLGDGGWAPQAASSGSTGNPGQGGGGGGGGISPGAPTPFGPGGGGGGAGGCGGLGAPGGTGGGGSLAIAVVDSSVRLGGVKLYSAAGGAGGAGGAGAPGQSGGAGATSVGSACSGGAGGAGASGGGGGGGAGGPSLGLGYAGASRVFVNDASVNAADALAGPNLFVGGPAGTAGAGGAGGSGAVPGTTGATSSRGVVGAVSYVGQ
jgi:hypothetical protein